MLQNSSMTSDPDYVKTVTPEVSQYGDEYIRQVNKRSNPGALKASPDRFFVCPVGIVGSGKTTVLTRMERSLDFVRVSGDEIRELLFNHSADPGIAWKIGAYVVDHYARQGFNVAHDTDAATQATRDNINELASNYSYKVFWIHTVAPEDFILNKLRNHEPSYLFSNADEAIARYNERKLVHKSLREMDYIATIDTSRDDLDSQVEDAVGRIKQQLSE